MTDKTNGVVSTKMIEEIRSKFENHEYLISKVPELLTIDNDGVRIHQEAPNPNIIEIIEQKKKGLEVKPNIPTPKLRAFFGSNTDLNYDSDACVQKVPKAFFKSRETLDELNIQKKLRKVDSSCTSSSRISMREALQSIFIHCSCDMEYYLANRNELEADLGRQFGQIEIINQQEIDKLEQELFYINMCKIFGPEIVNDKILENEQKDKLYEKSYMLENFSILSYNGNTIYATAERGEDYLLFFNTF